MATYTELFNLNKDTDIQNKAEMAMASIMTAILNNQDTAANGFDDVTANHDKRVKWASESLSRVRAEAQKILWPVLIENEEQSVATIKNAPVDSFVTFMKHYIVNYTNTMGA